MKNLSLLLLLFAGICFAQQDVKKDSVYDFRKIFNVDWNKSNKDFSFEYNKKNTLKYAKLSVYDDFNGLIRDYIHHDKTYNLKRVTINFEKSIFRDDDVFSKLFN